jgi:hypothetical protein
MPFRGRSSGTRLFQSLQLQVQLLILESRLVRSRFSSLAKVLALTLTIAAYFRERNSCGNTALPVFSQNWYVLRMPPPEMEVALARQFPDRTAAEPLRPLRGELSPEQLTRYFHPGRP